MSTNISTGLKARRKALGLSVRDVQTALKAGGVDVSEKTIYSWESGYRQPDADTFLLLCDIYKVDTFRVFDLPKKEKASGNNLSLEAMQLAKLFDTLDNYGQDAVREVAQVEKARCEDEERFLREAAEEPEDEVLPDFTFASAAGPLLGVAGQESVPYVLQPGDPRGAVYTTRVSGDSMEPYFPDGSRVFVNMDQVRDGDIGIFCVDGVTVIKQYHHDDFMGITYLFSLNRKRADADVVITPNSGRSLFCQGRVITKRRFPTPM